MIIDRVMNKPGQKMDTFTTPCSETWIYRGSRLEWAAILRLHHSFVLGLSHHWSLSHRPELFAQIDAPIPSER
jgi:hypothetical protein